MREQNTLLPQFAIFVVAIISAPWRAVKLFAYLMASTICRLCARKAERPHYTAIFSKESLQVGLPGRLSSMLGIPVVQNDSCPQRICRACMRKFTSVETHIKQLQQTAQTTYHKFIDGPSSRKRTKDTSGTVGVSPHTQRARPPAKRAAPSRLFLQPDSTYTHKNYIYT